MKTIGANTVRLYHSMGIPDSEDKDHGEFLDRAHDLGMNVLPGVSSSLQCDKFDCFDAWKNAFLKAFKNGFVRNSSWHPAVSMVILQNEPDFFGAQPGCQPTDAAWCRVKAVLSAFDALLAAEREAGVNAEGVNVTVTWSFGQRTSIDGVVKKSPGVYGFQDMIAGIKKPSLAYYRPRTAQKEFEAAFAARWTHGLNTAAPAQYVVKTISDYYSQYDNFGGHPWFIGEDGELWQTADAISEHTKQALDSFNSSSSHFLGQCFFQFQTAYEKGIGSEMNFGIFSLGNKTLGEVVAPSGKRYPVRCLTPNLTHAGGLNDQNDDRAHPVAKAYGGSVANIHGLCPEEDTQDKRQDLVVV
eukprot:TRINITY_DN15234_c0_g1_i1.p1 TRINITY_DN15234_c0_g1~~TRINITY_DN15234_c0_g1_i1.p1  ORF type:complete len:394 (-),score=69.27 TRINITY_DN15234_c0_g1_i1:116-1183(-)